MTQQIHKKIDKFSIAKMPTECFNGRIIVVNQVEDAIKAVNFLMRHKVLGFDTETKPSFKKGRVNKVALLQIATRDDAFLFQLNSIGITDDIMRLLEDKNILKVGLSISDDIRALTTRRYFTPSVTDLANSGNIPKPFSRSSVRSCFSSNFFLSSFISVPP